MTLILQYTKKSYVNKASKKKAFNRAYLEIHRIADSKVREIKGKFITATDQARQSIDKKKLTALIDQKNMAAAQEIVPVADLRKRYDTIWSSVLPIIQKSGEATVANMPKDIRSRMSFDLVNQRTVQFLQNYKFNLVRQLSNNTIEGVRQAVLNGVENGRAPAQIARQIVDLKGFGLTGTQSKAVENYRRSLEVNTIKNKLRRELDVKNVPSDAFNYARDRALLTRKDYDLIDTRVGTFQDRALRGRANTIARTETIRSANAGQLETWHQALQSELIPRGARKVWIVTPDDKLCPICEGIEESNPDGVGLSENFNYDYSYPPPNLPLDAPPAHPNCRCAMGLTDDIGDVVQASESDLERDNDEE